MLLPRQPPAPSRLALVAARRQHPAPRAAARTRSQPPGAAPSRLRASAPAPRAVAWSRCRSIDPHQSCRSDPCRRAPAAPAAPNLPGRTSCRHHPPPPPLAACRRASAQPRPPQHNTNDSAAIAPPKRHALPRPGSASPPAEAPSAPFGSSSAPAKPHPAFRPCSGGRRSLPQPDPRPTRPPRPPGPGPGPIRAPGPVKAGTVLRRDEHREKAEFQFPHAHFVRTCAPDPPAPAALASASRGSLRLRPCHRASWCPASGRRCQRARRRSCRRRRARPHQLCQLAAAFPSACVPSLTTRHRPHRNPARACVPDRSLLPQRRAIALSARGTPRRHSARPRTTDCNLSTEDRSSEPTFRQAAA